MLVDQRIKENSRKREQVLVLSTKASAAILFSNRMMRLAPHKLQEELS